MFWTYTWNFVLFQYFVRKDFPIFPNCVEIVEKSVANGCARHSGVVSRRRKRGWISIDMESGPVMLLFSCSKIYQSFFSCITPQRQSERERECILYIYPTWVLSMRALRDASSLSLSLTHYMACKQASPAFHPLRFLIVLAHHTNHPSIAPLNSRIGDETPSLWHAEIN